VPETFIIAPDGTVRRKVFSAVDEALLVGEIEGMLAEQGTGEEAGSGAEEVGP
jgi:hypothetical protein